jgi:hypothetical protein
MAVFGWWLKVDDDWREADMCNVLVSSLKKWEIIKGLIGVKYD